ALRADIGDLPYVQSSALGPAFVEETRLQPVPMGSRRAAGDTAERLEQPEFLMALAPFAQRIGQPVERFVGLSVPRQKRFERLHRRGSRRARQPAIGYVRIDQAPTGIRDENAVGMRGEEAAGKLVRA